MLLALLRLVAAVIYPLVFRRKTYMRQTLRSLSRVGAPPRSFTLSSAALLAQSYLCHIRRLSLSPLPRSVVSASANLQLICHHRPRASYFGLAPLVWLRVSPFFGQSGLPRSCWRLQSAGLCCQRHRSRADSVTAFLANLHQQTTPSLGTSKAAAIPCRRHRGGTALAHLLRVALSDRYCSALHRPGVLCPPPLKFPVCPAPRAALPRHRPSTRPYSLPLLTLFHNVVETHEKYVFCFIVLAPDQTVSGRSRDAISQYSPRIMRKLTIAQNSRIHIWAP